MPHSQPGAPDSPKQIEPQEASAVGNYQIKSSTRLGAGAEHRQPGGAWRAMRSGRIANATAERTANKRFQIFNYHFQSGFATAVPRYFALPRSLTNGRRGGSAFMARETHATRPDSSRDKPGSYTEREIDPLPRKATSRRATVMAFAKLVLRARPLPAMLKPVP